MPAPRGEASPHPHLAAHGTVVLSFLLNGNAVSMQTVLTQTCRYLRPSTPVVVHINSKSPVRDLAEWTSHVHRLSRPNGSAPILPNPTRLRVLRQRGTVLLAHLLNFRLAAARLPPFSRFALLASNVVLFRPGVEAWVARHELSFAVGWELPRAPLSSRHVVVQQTDGMRRRVRRLAREVRAGVAPRAEEWPDAAGEDGCFPLAQLPHLGESLRRAPCGGGEGCGALCFNSSRMGVVPMSHEGAFFSRRVLARFDAFVRERRLDEALESAEGACEEYWISTWLLATQPGLVLCPAARWVPPFIYRLRGVSPTASPADGAGRGVEDAINALVGQVRAAAAESFIFGYKVMRSRKTTLPSSWKTAKEQAALTWSRE
ncbi:hypothetical protein AB1Y20_005961 [Prymnesium parvum]|uniref:Protein xylosyltransferase n=1 Tax=Prymnesium parvum TaxID=97485 RepID=A0AB34J131_PRYPA